MPGETDLAVLLRHMRPRLNEGVYVFCSLAKGRSVPWKDVVAFFREEEGPSLILERSVAERHQMAYTFEAAWITLTVHSALEAVGLTAAVATALAERDIGCNVAAAYHHDHIFVEYARAEEALVTLEALSKA